MLSEMKSYCHVKPGQNGSKRPLEQYGDRLLCVRYRYDEQRQVRVKTVEIIVEERPWQPPFKFRDEDLVPVTVGLEEIALLEKLRKARGTWDPQEKVWRVRYGKVRGTELETRIPAEFIKRGKKR